MVSKTDREEFKRLVIEVGQRRTLFAERVSSTCASWGATAMQPWIYDQALLLYRCRVSVNEAASLIIDKIKKIKESDYHRHEIRYCDGNLRGIVFGGIAC